MNRFLLIAALIWGWGSAVEAQPEAPPTREEMAASEKSLATALEIWTFNLRAANAPSAQMTVWKPRVGAWGAGEWLRAWNDSFSAQEIAFDHAKIETFAQETATVTVSYRLKNRPGYAGQADKILTETLQMRRATQPLPGNGAPPPAWLIIPGANDEVWKKPATSLERVALALTQNRELLPKMRSEVARWRLERLWIAMKQISQDYNGYAFAPEYWEEMLAPYLLRGGKDTPLLVPGTARKWTFNPRVSGAAERFEGEPRFVLFYDGEDEDVVFRFEGRAAVCFDEGVEFIDPERVNELRFQPAPGTRGKF